MKHYLLSMIIFLPLFTWAQFGSQRVIFEHYNFNYWSITSEDLDKNGTTDIIGTIAGVSIYSNNGQESFTRIDYYSLLSGMGINPDVHLGDIDKDGDGDVFITAYNNISWYENLGDNVLSEQKIISTELLDARTIRTEDLDNDGDLDILSASYGNHHILWFKNENNGQFISDTIFYENNPRQSRIAALAPYDVDQDQDMDVIAAFYDKVVWFKNEGIGNFSTPKLITSNVRNAYALCLADFNQDDKQDFLVADEGRIAWYSSNGSENFGEANILVTQLGSDFSSVAAADFDQDGDVDVVSAAHGKGQIAWYQNNGFGNFGAPVILTNEAPYARKVLATDLDSDGDKDVVFLSYGKIAWYENLTIQSTPVNDLFFNSIRIDVYPNPFCDQLYIKLNSIQNAPYKLYLSDATGKLVLQIAITEQLYKLQPKNLPPGFYFYQLLDHQGRLLGSGKLTHH